jgi:transketolase
VSAQTSALSPPLAGINDPALRAERVAAEARLIRRRVLTTIGKAGMGHVGGDLSVADILATLFFAALRIDPRAPTAPDRDRFILSKGHCAAALYATLAGRGFLAEETLQSFMRDGALLNGHPNRKIPGVEANTGPLGHGLPIAVGSSVAAKLSRADWRVFVVLGDGELQEGSNWEAAMCAAHYGLDNLTAIVDRNRLQQGARTEDTNRLEPLAEKWRAFGWETVECDGHDPAALYEALTFPRDGRPRSIIAHTIKGKGVSFIEDRVEWHHKAPTPAQIEAALTELA